MYKPCITMAAQSSTPVADLDLTLDLDVDLDPVEHALYSALETGGPPRLREAMAYAVFPGGARVRPRLTLAIASACGGSADAAASAAAAVELLHCASLVHDDLPCFDDASVRRGRPSVHKAYGEPMALLVGDALIVSAFAAVDRAVPGGVSILADAAGAARGIVGGQAWELEPSGPPDLATYHRAKTAALFEAAAALGAAVSGLPHARFVGLGRAFGLAYQVADDLADALATEATLGKPVGRDALLGRPTALANGVDVARARFQRAAGEARAAIPQGRGAVALERFVDGMLTEVLARISPA